MNLPHSRKEYIIHIYFGIRVIEGPLDHIRPLDHGQTLNVFSRYFHNFNPDGQLLYMACASWKVYFVGGDYDM